MTDHDPADLFKRARSIAEDALGLAVEERESFITSSCGDDTELRSRVDDLLSNAKTADSFLEKTVEGDLHAQSRQKMPGQIGRYKIRRIVGQGGMGVVYEAVQQSPRRTVALKMIKQGVTSRSALRRFEYEAQTLGRLHHEGIAQIYEAGTWDDGSGTTPWFAMEYIAGAKPLTTYANEKELGTRERLALFMKICEAISHGHQKGIIHRDLKPGNILVDVNGQPKIIDYGIARATDSDMVVTTLQTDVGQLLGTVQYMSPEQCAADPDILDTRSDVYSLGVILYELLCDGLPYDLAAVPVFEAARVIREKEPVRPSTINRTLRGDIETIVLKALQKDRDQRYQSAHELQQDIQRYLDNDPISARPPSLTYQVKVFARRNRALFISATVIAAVLVAATVVSITLAVRASRSAAEARAAERNVLEKQEKLEASQKFLIHVLAIPTPSIAQGRDLTHQDLLQIAGNDIDDWFDGMPAYQNDHHALIGYFMVRMGMHDQAEEHLRPALSRLEENLGRDHWKTQFTLITIARMREGQGHPKDAARISADVEAWVRAHDEPWDPLDIEFLIYRAEILDSLSRWDETITLAEELLEHLETVRFDKVANGFTQEEIELRVRGLLARNLLYRSQLEQDPDIQGEIFLRSHEMLQSVVDTGTALPSMGPRHPVTLDTAAVLALCQWGSGMDTSITDVDEAIEQVELVYGEDNPKALQYQVRKGSILYIRKKFPESEETLRRALASLEEQLDPDHPSVQTAKAYLGRTLARQSKHAEAEVLLRESMRILNERVDPDHIDVIMTRGLYGLCLLGLGRFEEAEPYHIEFVQKIEAMVGPAHQEPLSIRLLVIKAYFDDDQQEEALRRMESFLEHARSVLPEDDPKLVAFQNKHGDFLRDSGRNQRALAVYEQVHQDALEHLPPGHTARWATLSDLQAARAANGDIEGALEINAQVLADARSDEVMDLEKVGWALGGRLKILEGTDRQAEVDEILEDHRARWWDDQFQLNALAWGIVDDFDHDHARERYPDELLQIAQRACELTDNTSPYNLDTLARVHFIRGDIDEAIAWQERAIEFAPLDDLQSYQVSLEEYENALADSAHE